MSKRRSVVLSVVLEGRTQAQTARLYGVSEGWVFKPESTDWPLVSAGFAGRWRVGVASGCWGCGLVCLGVLG